MTLEEEKALASWIARPEWPQMRRLLSEILGVDLTKLDALIRRVRKEVWADFSASDPT